MSTRSPARTGTPRDLLTLAYTRVVEDRFARDHGVIDLTARADAVMRVAPLDHAPAPLPLPPGTPNSLCLLRSSVSAAHTFDQIDAIGGLTMGADPVAYGVAAVAALTEK